MRQLIAEVGPLHVSSELAFNNDSRSLPSEPSGDLPGQPPCLAPSSLFGLRPATWVEHLVDQIQIDHCGIGSTASELDRDRTTQGRLSTSDGTGDDDNDHRRSLTVRTDDFRAAVASDYK